MRTWKETVRKRALIVTELFNIAANECGAKKFARCNRTRYKRDPMDIENGDTFASDWWEIEQQEFTLIKSIFTFTFFRQEAWKFALNHPWKCNWYACKRQSKSLFWIITIMHFSKEPWQSNSSVQHKNNNNFKACHKNSKNRSRSLNTYST